MSTPTLRRWVSERFFHHIDVDAEWVERVRRVSRKGPVVYILRNLSVVDFFALDYLTRRYDLPRVRFVNDLGLFVPPSDLRSSVVTHERASWPGSGRSSWLDTFVFEPLQRGVLPALQHWARQPKDTERLRHAIRDGASAALFLKRPANLFEPKSRGRIEGDAFLRTLFAVQREIAQPIQLCPQVFVWSRGPDTVGQSPLDVVFGPREWPGTLRTLTQFAMNYRHVTLRAGEPVDLAAFLRASQPSESDEALLRRATYALLRRIERERRAVTGPLRKPVDRVRSEVIRSPRLQKMFDEVAPVGDPARAVLTDKVDAILREMEAAPEPAALPLLDRLFERTVRRMYQGFLLDEAGLARLREVSKDATLVLLPNHRSHVDYLILSKVFHDAKMPVPLVAAGDNLNFFPAGPVLRRAGAFYLRRSFRGDRLYAAVLEAYVRRLIREGHPLEFFLEGGRSRTGRLLPPKRGLLAMVVDSALGGGRPVYFCPIAITYERVPEERAYLRELTGASKEREDARGLVRSARVLRQSYGHLAVEFAEPIALAELVREHGGARSPAKRRGLISALANRTMRAIAEVSAVTPGAVVATVLLAEPGRAMPHDDLVQTARDLIEDLRRQGARLAPLDPARGALWSDAALVGALRLFLGAGHVEALREGAPLGSRERHTDPGPGALYRVADEARLALDLAKSGIVHWFMRAGLAATVLLTSDESDARTLAEHRQQRLEQLATLLRFELQGEPSAFVDHAWDTPVEPDALWLRARIVEPFVESYHVAARTVQTLKPAQTLSAEELTKRALRVGDRMHAKGEIRCREALVRPSFDNAWQSFVQLGYLAREDGALRLADSIAAPELRRTVEQRVASFRLRK